MQDPVRAMLKDEVRGLSPHVCKERFLDKLTVAYLVDGLMFLPCKFPILIDSIFFEEISNFVT
jgi:hypothetical protein